MSEDLDRATSERFAALEARLEELERLADERDICVLMHRYIEACDHVRQAPHTASMFTEDATWEGTNRYREFGVTVGRDAIREMFEGTPEQLPLTVHWLTNAVVEVAPDRASATGRWEVVQAATFGQSGTQVWVAARYDNEFRKVDGHWLIHHIRYADVFVTPFEDGWDVTRYVSPFTGERTAP